MANLKPFIRTTKKKEANIRFRLNEGRSIDLFGVSEIKIKPEYWSNETNTLKQRYVIPEKEEILQEISDLSNFILKEFKDVDKDNITKDWLNITIEKFHHPEKYIDPKNIKQAFFEIFEEFLIKYELSATRAKNFKVVYRSLQRYELYSGKTINIDTLSSEDLNSIDWFLKNEYKVHASRPDIYESIPETRKPQQRGQNAINDIFTKIRTLYRWAIKNHKTTNNPFENFAIKECIYGTPYYITVDERNQLYSFDLSSRPQLAIQRDIFVFQCLIGCRVGDLYKMTKANVINNAVEYVPRKTKEGNPVTVRIPLNKTAKEILERYPDNNKLLPFISEQKYNYAIKEAFKLAGITRIVTVLNPTTREEEKKPINEVASSHLARRCFIGNLYAKVKDPNLVGSMSGHKEGSKAFGRYRTIDDEIKKEIIDLLD